MALTTYQGLKDTILNWLNREGDAATIAVIPDWIALAEADIRADIVTQNVTRKTDLSLNSGEVTLPADVKKPTDLYITESQFAGLINVVSPGQLSEIAAFSPDTGRPRACAFVNGKLLLAPAPDRAYVATLIYEPQLTPLVNQNDTNWVLTNHPNVYLYGALKHSGPWIREDERIPLWEGLYQAHVAKLEKAKIDYEYGAGQLVARPARPIGG